MTTPSPAAVLIPTAEIVQGNCLDVMATMASGSVDLTVTSPPYDSLREYEGYEFDFEAIAQELYRVTKPGGVLVWIVGDETIDGDETGTSFRQALYFKACGFRLHDTMIWDKGGFTAVGSLAVRYGPVFEYMFILSKGAPKTFNPIKDKPNVQAGNTLHGNIRGKDGKTNVRQTGEGVKRIARGLIFGPFPLADSIPLTILGDSQSP